MADWFKFYNDGIDSKGMQYAISEQPLAPSVWLVILAEASKCRASSIPWEDQDFELIGHARRINVSVPIFNQCLNLFERVGFIIRKDGMLHVPGWDKLQSDYAKGLEKGYYKNTSKSLASPSEVSRPRGEEIRREESRGGGEEKASPPPSNGFASVLKTSEKISYEKELDSIQAKLTPLSGGDLLPAAKERKKVFAAREKVLLGLLGRVA